MNKAVVSRLETVLLILAVLALCSIGIMMFGARLGLWQPIVGFGLVRNYMNPIAYVVTGVGLINLVFCLFIKHRCSILKSLLTLFIGVVLLSPTIYQLTQPSVRLPPIHDISTDLINPPAFQVLDDNREGARNSLVYGGQEVADAQQKAYPDIAPIFSDKTLAEAFQEALSVADEMGWEIIAADQDAFRFEASARTPVYQFIDDVVVVVTASGNQSRVDIRSVSRIGRSDRGVNAKRIRAFTEAFQK